MAEEPPGDPSEMRSKRAIHCGVRESASYKRRSRRQNRRKRTSCVQLARRVLTVGTEKAPGTGASIQDKEDCDRLDEMIGLKAFQVSRIKIPIITDEWHREYLCNVILQGVIKI
jgi:hypothetical protein